MIKKVLLSTLFVLFSGALVVGAWNRTSTQIEKVNGAQESEQHSEVIGVAQQQQQRGGNGVQTGQQAGTQQQTQEQQQLQAQQEVENQEQMREQQQTEEQQQIEERQQLRERDQKADPASVHSDFETVAGIVQQVPAPGLELVLDTPDGLFTVSTGPSNWLGTQIVLRIGDQVIVSGFWESGIFKATTITRIDDGLFVTLRDELGRPLWRGGSGGQGQGGGPGGLQQP